MVRVSNASGEWVPQLLKGQGWAIFWKKTKQTETIGIYGIYPILVPRRLILALKNTRFWSKSICQLTCINILSWCSNLLRLWFGSWSFNTDTEATPNSRNWFLVCDWLSGQRNALEVEWRFWWFQSVGVKSPLQADNWNLQTYQTIKINNGK